MSIKNTQARAICHVGLGYSKKISKKNVTVPRARSSAQGQCRMHSGQCTMQASAASRAPCPLFVSPSLQRGSVSVLILIILSLLRADQVHLSGKTGILLIMPCLLPAQIPRCSFSNGLLIHNPLPVVENSLLHEG